MGAAMADNQRKTALAASLLAVGWRGVPLWDLDAADVPSKRWVLEGLVPEAEPTLLAGHGGAGKSMFALHFAVCVASGKPFFGIAVERRPVVYLSGEDDAETVRRRVQGILRQFGLCAADVAGWLTVIDATDAPELFGPQDVDGSSSRSRFRRVGPTDQYTKLRDAPCLAHGCLLIVDNASDTFAGDENSRPEVRAFVRALKALVKPHNGAVLLLAHVGKATSRGQDQGNWEAYSGSTAWHNSVRSRLFLKDEDDGGAVLWHQKSNHGRKREPLRLRRLDDGTFTAVEPLTQGAQSEARERERLLIVRLIAKRTQAGGVTSTAASGPGTAYKTLKDDPSFPKGMRGRQFQESLRDAERLGLLAREPYTNSDRKQREKWAVTAKGIGAIFSAASAPVAPVAPVPAIGAIGADSDTADPGVCASHAGGCGGIGATGATGAEDLPLPVASGADQAKDGGFRFPDLNLAGIEAARIEVPPPGTGDLCWQHDDTWPRDSTGHPLPPPAASDEETMNRWYRLSEQANGARRKATGAEVGQPALRLITAATLPYLSQGGSPAL